MGIMLFQSEWCKYEYQLAHYSVMKERHSRVIMILMDDLNNLDLDRSMKAYIRTHTYLSRSDSLFWQKLLYAMPQLPISHIR